MYTKILLSFIGGASIGALITFALMKERHQEEIDILLNDDESEESEEEIKNNSTSVRSSIDYENSQVEEMVKYNKIASLYDDDVIDDEEEPNTMSKVVIPEEERVVDTNEPPYPISFEDFDTSYEHYDKLTVHYYEGDDTLADSREEIIPDPERIVGEYALNEFGFLSGDDNVVYVRNHKLGVDYEVCRVEGSYNEVVLGITEE